MPCTNSPLRSALCPALRSEEYEEQLAGALRAALDEPGADHVAVYELVTATRRACIDYTPAAVDRALLQGELAAAGCLATC